jgi:hypothetical protein
VLEQQQKSIAQLAEQQAVIWSEAAKLRHDDRAESSHSKWRNGEHETGTDVILTNASAPESIRNRSPELDCQPEWESHGDSHKSPATPKSAATTNHSKVTRHSSVSVVHMADNGVAAIVKNTKFDLTMGIVIILNLVMMFVHLDMQGYDAARDLGISSSEIAIENHWFELCEMVFNAIYLIELILKVYVFKRSFFYEAMNVVDAFLVIALCLDSFLLQPFGMSQGETRFLPIMRVLRIMRVMRIVKVVRLMVAFTELRILLRTLSLSVGCLAWSMLVLGFIIFAGGMLVAQLTYPFIIDEANDLETRVWVYESFGTASRASYTMFEATFTGSWFRYSRRLIEEVSVGFALFWVLYTVAINFAMMRVVTALFLKQTMSVAAFDRDKAQMAKMQEKEAFASKLKETFMKIDTSGDGTLSKEEFEEMVKDEETLELFAHLNLDELELTTLFRMLKNENDELQYDHFVMGALTMKNSSQILDTVRTLHNQMKLAKEFADVKDSMAQMQFLLEHSIPPASRSQLLGKMHGLVRQGSKKLENGGRISPLICHDDLEARV